MGPLTMGTPTPPTSTLATWPQTLMRRSALLRFCLGVAPGAVGLPLLFSALWTMWELCKACGKGSGFAVIVQCSVDHVGALQGIWEDVSRSSTERRPCDSVCKYQLCL